ncbi:DNA mismatch repair protein MutT [Actinocatenispora thailandica]|uniref:DNA mismatch repair protein MutT n=1 Tax=Actinocatenispora thailandica TaxID=227318 RepID=A0A7R7DL60_9ACTN|nr:DNA mismatch repair protein MutT [Actinocatenispora thailandica]
MARNTGRRLFYLPGGRREAGESRAETLVREAHEELGVRIDPTTMRHFGTWVAMGDARPELFRMVCFTASYAGEPRPLGEIAELGWFGYRDYARVTVAEQYVFDALRADGRLGD